MQALQSDQINEIVKALAKAQLAVSHAILDSQNPHFGSSFASLESVINATKGPYLSNDLVVVQQPTVTVDGRVILVTTLAHASGQWMRSFTPVLAKDAQDPQKMGSGLTYARRYALAAMANIGQKDDDGRDAGGVPWDQKITEIIGKYKKLGVTEAMLNQWAGVSALIEITEAQLADLNRIGQAIVDKVQPAGFYFKAVKP